MCITKKRIKKVEKLDKRYSLNKQSRRIGVAEGKLPDFDLDKFNSIDVTEDFYGKDE